MKNSVDENGIWWDKCPRCGEMARAGTFTPDYEFLKSTGYLQEICSECAERISNETGQG